MDKLKTNFIIKCLAEYNDQVIVAMRAEMRRLGVGKTDEAYQSLAYKVVQSGQGAYSTLSFREYLRMIDMGVGRRHPLGGLAIVGVELQSSKAKGISYVKDKVRKPKKVYTKVAFGRLSYLQGKLLYGFGEEAIKILKEELEAKQ